MYSGITSFISVVSSILLANLAIEEEENNLIFEFVIVLPTNNECTTPNLDILLTHIATEEEHDISNSLKSRRHNKL